MSNICLVFRAFISDVKLLTTIHQAIVASCQSIVYIPTMSYPIQVVVRETGLSAHVLRVWEKRYGAVVPQRTATQRRVRTSAETASSDDFAWASDRKHREPARRSFRGTDKSGSCPGANSLTPA